jgi:hypothetical protein
MAKNIGQNCDKNAKWIFIFFTKINLICPYLSFSTLVFRMSFVTDGGFYGSRNYKRSLIEGGFIGEFNDILLLLGCDGSLGCREDPEILRKCRCFKQKINPITNVSFIPQHFIQY